jgi:predicted GNAT family N-acyltransferase
MPTVTSENKAEFDRKELEKRGLLKPEKNSNVDDISKKYQELGVTSDIYNGKNGIELSRIVVPKEKQNQGLGSQFMDDLTSHADKNNKRIFLSPSTDFGASSIERLKKFYKRYGFVENKGKSKDYSISHSMYRNPSFYDDSK